MPIYSLNLLLNVTSYIALVYIDLKLIAVARSRTKHFIESVKSVSCYGSWAAAEATFSRVCFFIKCNSSSGIVSAAHTTK